MEARLQPNAPTAARAIAPRGADLVTSATLTHGPHSLRPGHQRSRVMQGAQAILGQGGWCVLEVCLNVPGQQWEARALILDLLAEAVADTGGHPAIGDDQRFIARRPR